MYLNQAMFYDHAKMQAGWISGLRTKLHHLKVAAAANTINVVVFKAEKCLANLKKKLSSGRVSYTITTDKFLVHCAENITSNVLKPFVNMIRKLFACVLKKLI